MAFADQGSLGLFAAGSASGGKYATTLAERGLESNSDENDDPLGLSEEQANTDRLLRQLLGTAIADRYADFCRLSSGRLPLTVSRPLAGHALRELDSMVRDVLAVPMDARAADSQEEKIRRRKARRVLRTMGFDDPAWNERARRSSRSLATRRKSKRS
jgi:hypothetical protein